MIKFSIIVPIFNVEKYLSTCLDSLINQTYSNIEIICVNDGSNDNSLKILEEYSLQDNRIKIINQENQGVSVARNNGIKIATGDYILFVDADDWIELNTCELVNSKLDNDSKNLVIFNWNSVTDKTKIEKKYCKYKEIVIPSLFCTCAYSTEIIRNNCLEFPKNIKIAEDIIFMLKYIIASEYNYLIINKPLYNYLINRVDSATKTIHICEDISVFEKYILNEQFDNLNNILKNTILDFISRIIYRSWLSIPLHLCLIKYDKYLDCYIKKHYTKQLEKNTGYLWLRYKYFFRTLKFFRDLYNHLSYKHISMQH